MESWIESAPGSEDDSYTPLPRVRQLVLSAPSSESVTRMPTTDRKEEDGNLVLADCTISGDRGMLVFRGAEHDKIPVSPGEGLRDVTARLGVIVGMAILITGSIIWFSGVRQSANFSTSSDETPTQVAKSAGNVEARLRAVVASPTMEKSIAAAVGKPVATAPSVPAPEAAPTGATPMPTQVANSVGNVEARSTAVVAPRTIEKPLAATIGKPVATAPSVPAPEAASTGGTPTPMQVANGDGKVESSAAESHLAATSTEPATTALPTAAPVAPGPVPGPAPTTAGATQLSNNEIAMLVTRGKDFLKDGDLASARLLFQRAAAAGNAEAAFMLGTTFDPLFIRRMGVVGMQPDLARAREWYKRAAELGSVDASQQLATLQGRS